MLASNESQTLTILFTLLGTSSSFLPIFFDKKAIFFSYHGFSMQKYKKYMSRETDQLLVQQ